MMGDFRISVEVKVNLTPAEADEDEQKRGYEHVEPLSMWLNYHPDDAEERIIEPIRKYLDKAWAAARWNLDTAYRESQEHNALLATIANAERLKKEAAQAEIKAEAARKKLGES